MSFHNDIALQSNTLTSLGTSIHNMRVRMRVYRNTQAYRKNIKKEVEMMGCILHPPHSAVQVMTAECKSLRC